MGEGISSDGLNVYTYTVAALLSSVRVILLAVQTTRQKQHTRVENRIPESKQNSEFMVMT